MQLIKTTFFATLFFCSLTLVAGKNGKPSCRTAEAEEPLLTKDSSSFVITPCCLQEINLADAVRIPELPGPLAKKNYRHCPYCGGNISPIIPSPLPADLLKIEKEAKRKEAERRAKLLREQQSTGEQYQQWGGAH